MGDGKWGKRQMLIRFIIYLLGVAILAFGVVLNIKTDYGVSPVNSVPYCISQMWGLELGNATILCYLVYLIIEALLMKKNKEFQYRMLLQLPVGILFGKFTTLFNLLLDIAPKSHVVRILLLLAAVFFTALGIVLMVSMKIVPIPPDGLANEIAIAAKKDLGMGKMVFDLISVLLTAAVSLVFGGRIVGLGIGTVFCVFFIGRSVKWIHPLFLRCQDRLLKSDAALSCN